MLEEINPKPETPDPKQPQNRKSVRHRDPDQVTRPIWRATVLLVDKIVHDAQPTTVPTVSVSVRTDTQNSLHRLYGTLIRRACLEEQLSKNYPCAFCI